MSRAGYKWIGADASFPRSRGDEPVKRSPNRLSGVFSPLTRG